MQATTDLPLATVGYYPDGPLPYGEWMPVALIAHWASNPLVRSRPDAASVRLARSLQADGQVEPIVLYLDGAQGLTPVDGNRRLAAAQDLGWASIWAVRLDTRADPVAFALAKNMTARPWNTRDVIDLSTRVPDATKFLSPTQQRQVADLVARLGADAGRFAERYSLRAYQLARRVASYAGVDLTTVLHYIMGQDDGVIRRLEETMQWSISPNRLAEIVTEQQPIAPHW